MYQVLREGEVASVGGAGGGEGRGAGSVLGGRRENFFVLECGL